MRRIRLRFHDSGMRYRITYSWGHKDVLPSFMVEDTARAAYRAVLRLKAPMTVISVESEDGTRLMPISIYRLEQHAHAERLLVAAMNALKSNSN